MNSDDKITDLQVEKGLYICKKFAIALDNYNKASEESDSFFLPLAKKAKTKEECLLVFRMAPKDSITRIWILDMIRTRWPDIASEENSL